MLSIALALDDAPLSLWPVPLPDQNHPEPVVSCVVRVPEYDMERWVLMWGDLVTVTGPASLLEKLKCYAEILAEKYAGAK